MLDKSFHTVYSKFLFGAEQAIDVWSFRTSVHAASSTEELHSSNIVSVSYMYSTIAICSVFSCGIVMRKKDSAEGMFGDNHVW